MERVLSLIIPFVFALALAPAYIEWLLLAAATVLAFIPSLATGSALIAICSADFLSQKKRAARQIQVNPLTESILK